MHHHFGLFMYTHKTTDAGRQTQTATSYVGCDKVQTTWTPTVQRTWLPRSPSPHEVCF